MTIQQTIKKPIAEPFVVSVAGDSPQAEDAQFAGIESIFSSTPPSSPSTKTEEELLKDVEEKEKSMLETQQKLKTVEDSQFEGISEIFTTQEDAQFVGLAPITEVEPPVEELGEPERIFTSNPNIKSLIPIERDFGENLLTEEKLVLWNQIQPKATNPYSLLKARTVEIEPTYPIQFTTSDLKAPSSEPIRPSNTEVINSALNSIDPELVNAKERYRHETGRELILLDKTPDLKFENGKWKTSVAFSEASARILNVYASKGFSAAQEEARKVAGEAEVWSREYNQIKGDVEKYRKERPYLSALESGMSDIGTNVWQLGNNIKNVSKAVMTSAAYGFDSKEYDELIDTNRREQVALDTLVKEIPEAEGLGKGIRVATGLVGEVPKFIITGTKYPLLVFLEHSHRGAPEAARDAFLTIPMIAAGGAIGGITAESVRAANFSLASRATRQALTRFGQGATNVLQGFVSRPNEFLNGTRPFDVISNLQEGKDVFQKDIGEKLLTSFGSGALFPAGKVEGRPIATDIGDILADTLTLPETKTKVPTNPEDIPVFSEGEREIWKGNWEDVILNYLTMKKNRASNSFLTGDVGKDVELISNLDSNLAHLESILPKEWVDFVSQNEKAFREAKAAGVVREVAKKEVAQRVEKGEMTEEAAKISTFDLADWAKEGHSILGELGKDNQHVTQDRVARDIAAAKVSLQQQESIEGRRVGGEGGNLPLTPKVKGEDRIGDRWYKENQPRLSRIGAFYYEAGVRDFSEFANRLQNDLGPDIFSRLVGEKNIDRFNELAWAQRDIPEQKMLDIQNSQIAQLYGYGAEHIGDLTHRMSEHAKYNTGGFEFVKDKVDKLLYRLNAAERGDMDFELDFRTQIKNNVEYKQGRGREYYKESEIPKSDIEALESLKALAKNYANAHRALPVFNEVQKLAQEAAISYGEFDFKTTKQKLNQLKSFLDKGEEFWNSKALEGLYTNNRRLQEIFEEGRKFYETNIADPFFSGLKQNVIERFPDGSMKAESARNLLQKLGTKNEIEWTSGLLEYIESKVKSGGKISKSELLDVIQRGQLKIDEVVLGKNLTSVEIEEQAALRKKANESYNDYEIFTQADRDRLDVLNNKIFAEQPTKYDLKTYTAERLELEGGENPREVLLQIPFKEEQIADYTYEVYDTNTGEVKFSSFDRDIARKFQEGLNQESLASSSIRAVRNNDKQVFSHPHWNQHNIVAHFRANFRTLLDGITKVFHSEEFQSDWNQVGRKEGYRLSEAEKSVLVNRIDELNTLLESNRDDLNLRNKYREELAIVRYRLNANTVPKNPFMENHWKELSFKRFLRMAIENGVDGVTWTTSTQQQERYHKTLQTKDISYRKNKDNTFDISVKVEDKWQSHSELEGLNEDDLRNMIGREFAEKIIANTGDRNINNYRVVKSPQRDFVIEDITTSEYYTVGTGDIARFETASSAQNFLGSKQFKSKSGVISGKDIKVVLSKFSDYDTYFVNLAKKIGKKFGAEYGVKEIETQSIPSEYKFEYEGSNMNWSEIVDLGTKLKSENSRIAYQKYAYHLEDALLNSDKNFKQVVEELHNQYPTHEKILFEKFIHEHTNGELVQNKIRDAEIKIEKVHYLEITPQMRESLKQGFPLYETSLPDLPASQRKTGIRNTIFPREEFSRNLKDVVESFEPLVDSESGTVFNSGLNPSAFAYQVRLLYKGFRDSASFAERLVTDFGEAIRPHVQKLWDFVKEFHADERGSWNPLKGDVKNKSENEFTKLFDDYFATEISYGYSTLMLSPNYGHSKLMENINELIKARPDYTYYKDTNRGLIYILTEPMQYRGNSTIEYGGRYIENLQLLHKGKTPQDIINEIARRNPENREFLNSLADISGIRPTPEVYSDSELVENRIKSTEFGDVIDYTESDIDARIRQRREEGEGGFIRLTRREKEIREGRKAARESLTKNIIGSSVRSITLAQFNPHFRDIYEGMRDVRLMLNGYSSVLIQQLHDARAISGYRRFLHSANPKVAEAIYGGNEAKKVFTDPELTTLYGLDADGIKAYRKLRQSQDDILNLRMKQELYHDYRTLAKQTPGSPEYAKTLADIAKTTARYDALKKEGYVSLQRSGSIAIFAEDTSFPVGDPQRPIYVHAKNWKEANNIVKDFKRQGFSGIESKKIVRLKNDFGYMRRLTPGQLEDLLITSKANVHDPEIKKIRDEVYSRYSSYGYNINRKMVRGYKVSWKNLLDTMLHQANTYSSSFYSDIGRESALDSLNASGLNKYTVNSVDSTGANISKQFSDKIAADSYKAGLVGHTNVSIVSPDPTTYNLTKSYIEDETTPSSRGIFGVNARLADLRTLTYITQMGLDVSQFFLNLTQPIILTYPHLAKTEQTGLKGFQPEIIFTKAMKAVPQLLTYESKIAKARKLGLTPKTSLPSDMVDFFKRAINEDVIKAELTTSYASSQLGTGTTLQKVSDWTSGFARAGEHVTRTHGFAAAYYTGKKKGLSGNSLYDFIVDTVKQTHGESSYGEAPRAIRAMGEFGRLFYQFGSFNQMWWENLATAIRSDAKSKNLLGLGGGATVRQLGSLGIVSGLSGLPLAAGLRSLLAIIYDRDKNEQFEREAKNYLQENVSKEHGETLKNLALYGVSTTKGISSRLGMRVPIFDSAVDVFTTNVDALNSVPAISTVKQLANAPKDFLKHDGYRFAEDLSPRAARNIVRAFRFSRYGARERPEWGSRLGDVVVPRGKFVDMENERAWRTKLYLQMVGVTPAEVTSKYEHKKYEALGEGAKRAKRSLRRYYNSYAQVK